jgi:hypothetical protein
MKIGSKLAIIVFCTVAIAHLLRVVFSVSLTIGTWNAPLWVSVLGFIGPGSIALLLWRESR